MILISLRGVLDSIGLSSWLSSQPSFDERATSIVNSVQAVNDKGTLRKSNELLAKIFSTSPNQTELVDPVNNLIPLIKEWTLLVRANQHLETQFRKAYSLYCDEANNINPQVTYKIAFYVQEVAKLSPLLEVMEGTK